MDTACIRHTADGDGDFHPLVTTEVIMVGEILTTIAIMGMVVMGDIMGETITTPTDTEIQEITITEEEALGQMIIEVLTLQEEVTLGLQKMLQQEVKVPAQEDQMNHHLLILQGEPRQIQTPQPEVVMQKNQFQRTAF